MNSGYGLWKEYENEWFNEWNPLLNAGYCIIFISHSEVRKMRHPVTGEEFEQLYPKGDKRTIDLIIDAVDFIGYVKSNGFDESGNAQMSSVYFQSCPEFLAGSRFKYMAPEITPFTAEGVQEAIREAVAKEVEESGVSAISFDERKLSETPKEISYEEAIEQAKALFKEMVKRDKTNKTNLTTEIVEKYLGEGAKISETNEKQIQQILMIIEEFNEVIDG